MNSPKTIIVTGGTGFLGTKVCQTLRSAGYDVIAVSATKKPGAIEVNYDDPEEVSRFVQDRNPFAVIHTAGQPSPGKCKENPQRAFEMNAGWTQSWAKACDNGQTILIDTSSSNVFDYPPTSNPLSEETKPNPRHPYGRSKLAGEEAVRNILPKGQYCIARLPMLYGYNGPDEKNGLYGQLLQNAGIIIPMNNQQRANSLLIDDAAECFKRLLKRGKLPPLLHLGDSQAITRIELAQQISGLMDLPPIIQGIDNITEDPLRPYYSVLDTSLARSLGMGFHTIEAGLGIMRRQIEGNRRNAEGKRKPLNRA